MQVAKVVIEIEREAVSPQPAAVIDQPEATHTPEPTTASYAQKSYVGAAQLTLTALFQKFGAQGKQRRTRKAAVVPEQQLSLFGMLAAD